MFTPSTNVTQLRESATIAVANRARALKAEGRTVIDLGAGEPDFDTPAFIRHAAQHAIDHGATHYTATEGILPLREAIAAEANARYRGPDPVHPADVVVSTGSKQSLFNACFCLFGAGDEVLIPTPSWTSYYEMVGLAKATAVPVYGSPNRDLKVDAASLAEAATSRTRGLMLNSPSNPTGAVYNEAELSDILALAAEQQWWVISDEIYLRIAYGSHPYGDPSPAEPAVSALDCVPSRERLVVVNGVAKAYAMTGWRIGWAIANRKLASAMTALQSHTTSNAATVSQHAALAALKNTEAADTSIAEMVGAFRDRRDACTAILDQAGARYVYPAGAFYLYIHVGAGKDGSAFATQLLNESGVAIVPGAAFFTPEWVRVSYAAPKEQVVEGVRRLAAMLTRC